MNYRSKSIGARFDALLPDWPSFTVVFHELIRESEGGWSVNNSWRPCRNVSREVAIDYLRVRWQVFKENYLPRARVQDIRDAGDSEGDCLLEVDCTALATVERGECES